MTSFFDRWKTQRENPKTDGKQDSIRGIDRFDREDMDSLAAEMKALRDARAQLCDVAEMGGHMTTDTIAGFFKPGAELNDETEMDPRFLVNNKVQRKLFATKEWERLHNWTEGDLVSSGLAFIAIEDELEKLLKETKEAEERRKEWERKAEEQREAEDGVWWIEGIIDGIMAGNPTEEEIELVGGIWVSITDAIAEGRRQLENSGQGLEDWLNEQIDKHLPELKQDLTKVADAEEKAAAAARAWGIDPGQLRRMPAGERVKLAKKLSRVRNFEELTDLIGKIKPVAEIEQMRKVDYLPEEIYDVTIGNDLGRVLPLEMLNLMHPTRKLDFYRRFAEGELFEYQMRGYERLGKGPIIFIKDGSGSMAGQKEVWATATGLACASVAHDQKRSFVGINFGSAYELTEFKFMTEGDYSLERLIDYAQQFFSGGTDFQRPLARALEILQAEERDTGFTESDILFATDGCAGITADFMANFKAEQERLDFKVYGLMIGGSRTSEPLYTLCDGDVVTIDDVLSGENVRSIFRAL